MHTFNLQRPCTFLQGPSHGCAPAFYHLWSNVLAWYARDRSRYKTDTRNNEDGNVTRNVCVSSVVCLPKVLLCKIPGTSFARFEQNDHIIARRIRRHARNLQGGSQFRFNFPAHITKIFLAGSRGAFRGGVVSAFLQEQLHADATYHSWHLAQRKKRNGVQPEIDRDSCAPQSRQRLLLLSSR